MLVKDIINRGFAIEQLTEYYKDNLSISLFRPLHCIC